jgi:multiple sugar transport system ATP-binding protein
MNLVEVAIDGEEVEIGQYRVPLDTERRPRHSAAGRVVLGMRPETFEDAAFATRDVPTIDVDVEVVEELGSDTHVFFHLAAPRLAPDGIEAAEGDEAQLVADDRTLVNARVDPRTNARVGVPLRLAIDPARFHFFDPDTGASLLDHAERSGAVPLQVAG